jgi:ATP-dependent helicase/nuclease subunit A
LREAEENEHRRVLYVALTRAEERLYVAGFHGPRGPAPGCWLEAIRNALEPTCARAPDPLDETKEILFREGVARAGAAPPAPRAVEPIAIPAYARMRAPRESAPPPLRPSTVLAAADEIPHGNAGIAATRRDGERLLFGRLAHSLLQRLPDAPPERRAEAARRFLDLRGAALDAERRASLAGAALALLENPSLSSLFGSRSAPEVEIVARLAGARGEILVAGRIDRLAESDDEVVIADFKTGAPRRPPSSAQLRQLAVYRAAAAQIYPGKAIRCVLIFTQTASVEEPSPEELDAALADILREA